jgi:hypothetical protein
VKTLVLFCLAQFACACTPHEVRCDGRLEPINASVPTTRAASGTAAGSVSGVP